MDGAKTLLESLEGHLRAVVVAAGVVATYVYGVAYLAVSDYYGSFGLTPEDAGVSQGPLVARAVTAFAIIGSFLVFFGLGMWGSWSMTKARPHEDWWWRVRWFALLLVGAGALAVGSIHQYAAATMGFPLLLGLALGILVTQRPALDPVPLSQSMSIWRVFVVAASVLMIATLFATSLDREAADSSQSLRQDGRFKRHDFWNAIVRVALGIRTAPATAADIDCGRLVAAEGDRAWLLERKDGTLRLHAVARDTVVIQVADPASDCWKP